MKLPTIEPEPLICAGGEPMIERHHYFKLKAAFANPEGRRDLAAKLAAGLPGLTGVEQVVVGLPADDDALVWDVSLRLDFALLAAVAAYREDPAHRAFVAAEVAPKIEIKKVWNFTRVD